MKLRGKGKLIYVPKIVLEELGNVKLQTGTNKNSLALSEMCNYSKVGREVERIMHFGNPPRKRGRK